MPKRSLSCPPYYNGDKVYIPAPLAPPDPVEFMIASLKPNNAPSGRKRAPQILIKDHQTAVDWNYRDGVYNLFF